MGTAAAAGCVSAMTDAIVPDNMMGKMGRIHVGIMVCSPKLLSGKDEAVLSDGQDQCHYDVPPKCSLDSPDESDVVFRNSVVDPYL